MKVSCYELQESSLASTRCTNKGGLFALLDREREILEYLRIIITIGDILDFDVFLSWKKSGSGGVSLNNWSVIKYLP